MHAQRGSVLVLDTSIEAANTATRPAFNLKRGEGEGLVNAGIESIGAADLRGPPPDAGGRISPKLSRVSSGANVLIAFFSQIFVECQRRIGYKDVP